eukprot:1438781-Rhodomonas_salina.1
MIQVDSNDSGQETHLRRGSTRGRGRPVCGCAVRERLQPHKHRHELRHQVLDLVGVACPRVAESEWNSEAVADAARASQGSLDSALRLRPTSWKQK